MASFICAILSSQLQPSEGSQLAKTFRGLELTFTCIFCVVGKEEERRGEERMKRTKEQSRAD